MLLYNVKMVTGWLPPTYICASISTCNMVYEIIPLPHLPSHRTKSAPGVSMLSSVRSEEGTRLVTLKRTFSAIEYKRTVKLLADSPVPF